ncbi:MAG: hypothetical protein NZ656_09880 [Nitrospinaceae bacterium]|nr:hypothetical protein [Nitrospinaceae bacterium]
MSKSRGKKGKVFFWTLFSAVIIFFILWVTPEVVRIVKEKVDITETFKAQEEESKIVDTERPVLDPPEESKKEEPIEEETAEVPPAEVEEVKEEEAPPEEAKTPELPPEPEPLPEEEKTEEAPTEVAEIKEEEPPVEEAKAQQPPPELVKEPLLEPVKPEELVFEPKKAPEPLSEIAKGVESPPENLPAPRLTSSVDKFDMERLIKNQVYARGKAPSYLFNINNPDRIEIYDLMNFRLFAKDAKTGYFFDLKNATGYDLGGSKKKTPGNIKPASEFIRLFGRDMLSISRKNRDMDKQLRLKSNDGLKEVINTHFKRIGERRSAGDFSYYYVLPKNMNIYISKKNDAFISFSGMKEDDPVKVAGIVYKVASGKDRRGIYFPVALLAKGEGGKYTLVDKKIDLGKYLTKVDSDFKEIRKKHNADQILADLILTQKRIQHKYR